jgi:2-amino-4-hydroxy-6-hydroxymethyldihydropteridine diphosphokinase
VVTDVDGGGIYIALGSNLGNREAHVRSALILLQEDGQVRVVRCSSLHETEPVGGPAGQGMYLNAVAEVMTELPPRQLLSRMLQVETRLGRVRSVPNAPRTIDLDLLLYGNAVLDEPDLAVPHPRMWERDFVMKPLAEVCAPERIAAVRALGGTGAGVPLGR